MFRGSSRRWSHRTRDSRRVITLNRFTLALLVLAACSAGTEPGTPSTAETTPILFSRRVSSVVDDFEVYRIMLDGTGLSRITNSPGYDVFPTWFPDHSAIAFISARDGGGLFVMQADGRVQGPVYAMPAVALLSHRFSVSPSGHTIAFDRGSEILAELWTVETDGSNPHKIAIGTNPAWSPDGHTIAIALPEGINTIAPDGTGSHPLIPVSGAAYPAWSRDGRFIAYTLPTANDGAQVYVAAADGTGQRAVSVPDAIGRSTDRFPTWSPDGRFLVFQRESSRGCPGIPDCVLLLIIRADGSDQRHLTEGDTISLMPSW